MGTAIWANDAEPSQAEPERPEAQSTEALEEASEAKSESESVEAEASEKTIGIKFEEQTSAPDADITDIIKQVTPIENADECHGLHIGVNDYGNTLPSLRYAASDAKKIAGALIELGIPEKNVVTLISGAGEERRPSREKIMAALDEIVAKSGKNSRIFVTFSGHGFETLEDGAAAFAPTDVKVEFRDDAPCVLKDSAVLMTDVIKKLQGDDAKYKFLIVDACREPATVDAFDQRGSEGEKNLDAQNVPKKNASKAFANLRGIAGGLAFLQSCSSGESSWEISNPEGGGGGIFTFHLVEGLLGKAAKEDGKGDGVTFKDLCGYVRRKTRDTAEAIGGSLCQNPVSNYVDEADSENEPEDFDVVSPIKPRIARLLLEEAQKLRKLGRDEVRGYDLEKLEAARKLLEQALETHVGNDNIRRDVKAERETLILDLAAAWANAARKKLDSGAYAEALGFAEEAKKSFADSSDPVVPQEYVDLWQKCKDRRDAWQLLDEAEETLAAKNLTTAKAKVEESLRLWPSDRGKALREKIDKEIAVATTYYNGGRTAAFGVTYENAPEPDEAKPKLNALDTVTGVLDLSRAAERGWPAAKGALAVLYYEGRAETPLNFAEAFKLAKDAAESDDPWGQYVLGECYRTGQGVEKNEALAKEAYAKARAGFEKRADDDPLASTYLGLCCYGARGGKKDSAEALRRFRRAADDGLPLAAYWLANCYKYSCGVKEDAKQAFGWYQKSAEAGYPAAMNRLGLCYDHKYGVAEASPSLAFKQYFEGAKAGDVYAMSNLAYCYKNGRGVDKDEEKAVEWYIKSANAGNMTATLALGDYYYEYTWAAIGPDGWIDWAVKTVGVDKWVKVRRDSKKALEWRQRAADAGNAKGMLGVALCYEEGYGDVEKHLGEAKKWYEKAKALTAADEAEFARADGEEAKKRCEEAKALKAEAEAGLERVKKELDERKEKAEKKTEKEK